jgi:hypothetical protein
MQTEWIIVTRDEAHLYFQGWSGHESAARLARFAQESPRRYHERTDALADLFALQGKGQRVAIQEAP